MKKILLSLGVVLTSISLNAQVSYDLETILTTPASNGTVPAGNVSVVFTFKNNGPDAVPSGDTLFFGYAIGTSIFSFTGAAGQASGLILQQPLASGGTITSAQLGLTSGLAIDLTGEPNGTSVCIVLLGANGPALTQTGDPRDTDLQNNADCFTVNTPAGVEENVANNLKAFPNPANDVLNISNDGTIETVSIIGMDGKVISATIVNNASTSVNVADLKAGVYFYEVKTANGATVRNTFVKQ